MGVLSDAELNQITEKIIGCAFKVSNTLGIGFVEKVYERYCWRITTVSPYPPPFPKCGLKNVRIWGKGLVIVRKESAPSPKFPGFGNLGEGREGG